MAMLNKLIMIQINIVGVNIIQKANTLHYIQKPISLSTGKTPLCEKKKKLDFPVYRQTLLFKKNS